MGGFMVPRPSVIPPGFCSILNGFSQANAPSTSLRAGWAIIFRPRGAGFRSECGFLMAQANSRFLDSERPFASRMIFLRSE